MADSYSPGGFRLKEGATGPFDIGARVVVKSTPRHMDVEYAGVEGVVLGWTPFRSLAVVQADDGSEYLVSADGLDLV